MNDAVIHIDATLPDSGEQVRFYIDTTREAIQGLSKEETKAAVEQIIQEVGVDQPFAISDLVTSYQLVKQAKEPDFGNTLIQAHIPFCLHLPNGVELDIWNGDDHYARVICKKIWTEKAENPSRADVYAEDRATYFKKCSVKTPELPHQELLGWDLALIGENVEKIRDNTGYFRYTKLSILLDTQYTEVQLKDKDGITRIVEEIKEIGIDTVNRVLDTYRYITNDEFIERLGFVNITNIYFFEHNQGFYPVSMNAEGAMMNRSNTEIQEIQSMLRRGEKPPLHDLLLLNAQSSLNKRMFTLSVVSSFQSLEVYLENYLIEKYEVMGLSEEDIETKLNRTWRTKDRLRKIINETTGHSLFDDNRALWDSWCTMYDQVRKEVIHKGREVTWSETEEALRLNRNVIGWIKSL